MFPFLRRLAYGRQWPELWRMNKVVSDDGLYYYVPQLAMRSHPRGGWMQTVGAAARMGDHWMAAVDWLPFASWKVSTSGKGVPATSAEVAAYRDKLAGLHHRAGEV